MKPFVSLAILALPLLAGCGRSRVPAAAAPTPGPAVPARVATARIENLPGFTTITGTVRPVQRAQLAAKVMGVIDEMPVALGQRVRAGDLLVKISAGEINARLAQAQSQLNLARRDLERERALLPKGASTADMVRGLEDRLAGAEAMHREAEVMFGYATVRAPFDGVIARKLANAGDLASPGIPLLELEGATVFELETAVPDTLAATLAVGATVPVELPGMAVTLEGRVAEISSAADPAARTVTTKIALPSHAAVRSGQFARIQLPSAPVPTLFVPATAVSSAGQMQRVFIASRDNRAALRLVKTGGQHRDRIEVLSGVDDGERVVVAPPAGLREGQLLAPQP